MITPRLPAVFVSHGSPTFALEPGAAGAALAKLAATMPRPRAVLVISAHWLTRSPAVTLREHQEAWHDFGGFPPALYALRYSPMGAPWLAQRIASLLKDVSLSLAGDLQRPLDHGAWVPLRHLYPDADVPVMQLSLMPEASPAEQIALGRALAPLRDEGVLILASGAITHNLRDLDWAHAHAPTALWADAFRRWMVDHLQARDTAAIEAYRALAPHAVRAHPTDEHLLPVFVAYGAGLADAAPMRCLADEVRHATLAMDIYAFGRDAAA